MWLSSLYNSTNPGIFAVMIRWLRRLAVLILVAAPLALAPSALAAETGQIAGRVTFPGGGVTAQVSDVDVCAYSVEGEVNACAKPSSFSGEYTIEGLAGGEYKVGFSSEGFDLLPQYYDDKSSLAEAEPVPVTAGQTTSEINAELQTAGEITGRVTNGATGAPIAGIQVCVEPSEWVDCERANANGEYAFSELASGEYHLAFTPIGELDYFFYRQTGVSVTAGQVTANVDEGLTEGGRITGRVTDAVTGESVGGVEACAREVDGDMTQCGTTNAQGEYTILRLNGHYTVEFSSRGGGYLAQLYGGEPPLEYGRLAFSASQELSVTAPGTISGVDAALQPGTFAEPVNTTPPAISGTAAVGSALSCSPGSWTGDPAPTAFTYRWLSDGAPITGPTAAESSYTAQSADEGHSVSCKVYATNAAGSQIGTGHALSANVTIGPSVSTGNPVTSPAETTTTADLAAPAPFVTATPLVTLMASKLIVSGGTAPVHVACAAATCQGSIELTVQVPVKDGQGKTAADRKTTLVLATGSFFLAQGKDGSVSLRLTSAGRQKLAHARHHPIAGRLILFVRGGKAMTKPVLAF
jgi:hypothetical protein